MWFEFALLVALLISAFLERSFKRGQAVFLCYFTLATVCVMLSAHDFITEVCVASIWEHHAIRASGAWQVHGCWGMHAAACMAQPNKALCMHVELRPPHGVWLRAASDLHNLMSSPWHDRRPCMHTHAASSGVCGRAQVALGPLNVRDLGQDATNAAAAGFVLLVRSTVMENTHTRTHSAVRRAHSAAAPLIWFII